MARRKKKRKNDGKDRLARVERRRKRICSKTSEVEKDGEQNRVAKSAAEKPPREKGVVGAGKKSKLLNRSSSPFGHKKTID